MNFLVFINLQGVGYICIFEDSRNFCSFSIHFQSFDCLNLSLNFIKFNQMDIGVNFEFERKMYLYH